MLAVQPEEEHLAEHAIIQQHKRQPCMSCGAGGGEGAAPPSCTDFTPINLREEVGGGHYLPPSIVTAREPSPFLLNSRSQMVNLNPYKKSHLTLALWGYLPFG